MELRLKADCSRNKEDVDVPEASGPGIERSLSLEKSPGINGSQLMMTQFQFAVLRKI